MVFFRQVAFTCSFQTSSSPRVSLLSPLFLPLRFTGFHQPLPRYLPLLHPSPNHFLLFPHLFELHSPNDANNNNIKTKKMLTYQLGTAV